MTDHRQLAVDLFNHTWTLLDNKNRTIEQDDEMVHAAHASRHHWGIAGTAKHRARGEWQIARVYAALKRFSSSAHHAKSYMDACKLHAFGPFDLAFANEGLARALVSSNPDEAKKYLKEARQIGKEIEKDEDREWLHANLDEIASMIDAK
ncbi:MAG: hypothetical protein H8E86_05755 [Planctomycetes bacterium]|nr:hypothetical protein [Planctomycetota bacterium]